LPIVFKVTTAEKASISFSPLIFIGAAIFSYITVFISSRKPGKIAANVSPIEAVRYTGEVSSNKKAIKNSNRGGKIYRMAISNLTRNKKKTVIVIISMSLSLILLNSVFTIANGFDMDKFTSKFISTDFVIGHANYFNNNHFRSEDDEVSQKMINKVKEQEGFIDGGKIFYNTEPLTTLQNGVKKTLQLFGVEDFPLSKLTIVEGTLDLEKFKAGDYIIEGVKEEDNGDIRWESSKYSIGDKVTLKLEDGSEKNYEVMAKAVIKKTFHVRSYIGGADTMYLPAEAFTKIVKEPVAMNYVFNADKQQTQDIEKFLKEYTTKVEQTMNYESKKIFTDQFKELKNMFLTVGGALTFIIGIIGLLNFVNSILTSILARRREFAMLQSIGMTDKQLCRLLMYEGFFYALWTTGIMLALGAIFSLTVIRGVVGQLWFYSYKFVILPLLIAAPILILISIIIPFVIYKYSHKQSIVERLRESE
jgi:putative ABC transport system permease protein